MPIADPEKRREYHRRYMREIWYPKNKAKQLASARAVDRKIYDAIAAEKAARGNQCSICSQVIPGVALDFHHREADQKIFQIAQFKRVGAGLIKVRAEMEKCDLICANCHRVLHAKEREATLKVRAGQSR